MRTWATVATVFLCLANLARAADMRVHIGGHTYDLPRALDDGGSDHPDPRETILLRANAPGITPRTDEDAVNSAPLFAQNAVEILGQAVADFPGQAVTVEKERYYMRDTLTALITLSRHAPDLVLVSPDQSHGPHPDGEAMRYVQAPKPWNPDVPRVFVNGTTDAPTDVLGCGHGECQHWFVHNGALWQMTYGDQLIGKWREIRGNLIALLDRSEVRP